MLSHVRWWCYRAMTLFRKSYEVILLSLTNYYRLAFYMTFVMVTLLALLPQEQAVLTTGWDKMNHLLAFFVLALLIDRSYPRLSLWHSKLPLLLIYGLWIELLQWFMPGRFFSGLDVLADGLGLLIYAMLMVPLGCLINKLELALGLVKKAEGA